MCFILPLPHQPTPPCSHIVPPDREEYVRGVVEMLLTDRRSVSAIVKVCCRGTSRRFRSSNGVGVSRPPAFLTRVDRVSDIYHNIIHYTARRS